MNPVVEINLNNLSSNYRNLEKKFPDFWAVLKDNAYGLGIANVAKTLHVAGCKKFMVADIREAIEIKKSVEANDYEISVLNGFFSLSEAKKCIKYKLIPFLSTIEQIEIWKGLKEPSDFAIFLETGLNRFSLRGDELPYLLSNIKGNIRLVISHLACARNPQNKRNIEQKEKLTRINGLYRHGYLLAPAIVEKALNEGVFK